MSLRLRIALLNGVLLLASIALGALITGFEVRKVLGEELAAALAGARQTAASAFEDLPRSDHPARDLRQLVGTFDGNRHVRASLMGPRGRSVWASRSDDPGAPPPSWFRHMVEVAPDPASLPVPPTTFGSAALVLTPTPGLDVRAAWGEFSTLMIMFATMAAIGLLLVYLAIGAALKPLTVLALRFRQIGAGDYSGRVAETGPPELEHLQQGFNRMADELEDTTGRNRLLTEYVAKLQEEERAEIARDLHDEIGPHLFAVNLDAEMIAQLGATSEQGGIAERAREIQGSVQYMQRHVRDLLGRLRPTQVTEFGLDAAIEELVRFWSDRRPDIAFEVSSPKEDIPEPVAEIAYRIVQESLNNAVRHGQPTSVRITIERHYDRGLLVSVDNDRDAEVSPMPAIVPGSGLGLIGMRERVEAQGGTLNYGLSGAGSGWTVSVQLPLVPQTWPPPQRLQNGQRT
jgi:two-component system sensor histidine kinase UhpB